MFITSHGIGVICIVTIFYALLLTIHGGTNNNIVNASIGSNNSKGSLVENDISATSSANSVSPQMNQTFNDNNETIKVLASFYPIYEFVNEVGGDRVEATTLIPLGPYNKFKLQKMQI